MKPVVLLMVLGALMFAPVVRAASADETSESLGTPVVVKDGELYMRMARDCLSEVRQSRANEGDTVLLKVLEATGYKLVKLLAKEFMDDSNRIRFGLEFHNSDDVTTIYWELDCIALTSARQVAMR